MNTTPQKISKSRRSNRELLFKGFLPCLGGKGGSPGDGGGDRESNACCEPILGESVERDEYVVEEDAVDDMDRLLPFRRACIFFGG